MRCYSSDRPDSLTDCSVNLFVTTRPATFVKKNYAILQHLTHFHQLRQTCLHVLTSFTLGQKCANNVTSVQHLSTHFFW